MALERFWWGPSLDLLRDSHNGALWLEHCESEVCLFVLYCIHTVYNAFVKRCLFLLDFVVIYNRVSIFLFQ